VEEHVRRYANALSVEEMLPLVRQAGRVGPIMADWYQRNPFEKASFGRMVFFQPLALDARNFFVVRYELPGSDQTRTLLVEDLGERGVFVDWETAVCYQPMSWDQFVKDRPEGVLQFRVWAQPDFDGLYSHEFADESRWLAIRLSALGSDEFLIGYVERRTELETRLRELIEDNGYRQVALVLDLKVPKEVESLRGVIIEKLVSERWLVE
jgi:hypothetical protein